MNQTEENEDNFIFCFIALSVSVIFCVFFYVCNKSVSKRFLSSLTTENCIAYCAYECYVFFRSAGLCKCR